MTPLPIVDIYKDKVKINKSNFTSVLRKVGSRPFVLQSINGATRTGKSYALNFFIRYHEWKKLNPNEDISGSSAWFNSPTTQAFKWQSGKERTTVGIDLWSEPYFVTIDGREVAILLMDTQGLFDEKTTARQNAIIFSLSALCSSVSIFNVMKSLDENVLQQLQFYSGYANLVSVDETGTRTGSHSTEAFQKLMFLVRDFEFPDYFYGYHSMDSPGPLNFCRDTFIRSEDDCPQENLFVRKEILKCYRDVGMFLLPHPGKKFVRDDKVRVDEDFEENLSTFVQLMNSRVHLITKKIGGHEPTGTEFVKYIEAWAKLCENADQHFPKVQSILETTAVIQNTLAMSTAQDYYDKKMEELSAAHPDGVDGSVLTATHRDAQWDADDLFTKMKKMGGSEMEERYRSFLTEGINKHYKSCQQVNQMKVDRAAIKRGMEEQASRMKEMHGIMAEMGDEYERSRLEMEDKIAKAQQDLDNVTEENVAVREELTKQLRQAKEDARQVAKSYEDTQRAIMQQVEESNARIQRYEQRLQQSEDERKEMAARHAREMEELRRQRTEGAGAECAIL